MNRAELKKLRHAFKAGDIITWGLGRISHRVLEVRMDGVVVDATSAGFGKLFVSFDKNNRDPNGRGPIRHSTDEPDKKRP
jgi:hypothetical protein